MEMVSQGYRVEGTQDHAHARLGPCDKRHHVRVHAGDPRVFERARERAAALDAEFAQTKRLKGPLHGVPISVKVRGRCIYFGLNGTEAMFSLAGPM